MATAHPLLRLLVEQPQLLGEHVAAYAALASAEGSATLGALRRRVALQLAALACGAVAAGLAGVAVMLWAVLPAAGFASGAGWVLLVVPAVAVGVGVGLYRAARPLPGHDAFAALRQQGTADLALLRELHRISAGTR